MSEEVGSSTRIVVGVDGSPASKAALRWAVRQAAMTGGSIDVLIAWQYPVGYGWPAPVLGSFDFTGTAQRILADAVTETVGTAPRVDIRQHVVQDHPAAALLKAAADADLLVVGNRGHGGFTEALLGSVGQHCVQHARCPVVVVRATEPEPGAEP
ncbi:nucleotide-binding universal stress UspA family protein [Streptomyces sp. TLI_235]|nr:nucleotide-binding universal stress UspA family protein [Streptomyces sp. TLI_235]